MYEHLRSLLLQHLPPASVERAKGNGLTVEWAKVPGDVFSAQCQLVTALHEGDWFLDVEDVPEELTVSQPSTGGLGTLVRASRSSLKPTLFRELGRQVWLGLAGVSAPPAVERWAPSDLFRQSNRLSRLIAHAGCRVGIVSYFDSASWLIAERAASFDIAYPVVGSVRFCWSGDQVLSLADTYFEPLMTACFAVLLARDPSAATAPPLLRMWQRQTGAFDVEGGSFEIDSDDGLVDLLEEARDTLAPLDTRALETPDGSDAPSLEDARQALLFALRDARLGGARIQIEDIA